MAGFNKSRGQGDAIYQVFFKLVDTSGTPSITEVFPSTASVDISVADTAQGRATVTIKNFKGPQGAARVFITSQTTSTFGANVTPTYSGDSLSFEISIENDASTLTDCSADVMVVAY